MLAIFLAYIYERRNHTQVYVLVLVCLFLATLGLYFLVDVLFENSTKCRKKNCFYLVGALDISYTYNRTSLIRTPKLGLPSYGLYLAAAMYLVVR